LIRQDMQDELVKLQDRLKKTIIFVTHDLDEALKLGDRIALMKDGEVVQVGGSEDILLSPATEYVARFVENVDRSKALTAATVMRKPGILGFPKDGPLTALRKMQELGTSSLFVSDRSGRLIGVINAEDALIAHKNGEKSLNSITRTNIPTTSPDTPLCDLLETMATTKIPVAVVNEENRILGILVRGSVIAGIAGKGSDLSERK
jgi:glycine betaine/proline transport system ATP-binding protein